MRQVLPWTLFSCSNNLSQILIENGKPNVLIGIIYGTTVTRTMKYYRDVINVMY